MLVPAAADVVADTGVRWWATHYVPNAIFFFEAEGSLKELVFQRRRWLNGTSASFLWLLRQPELGRAVVRCAGVRVLLLSLVQLAAYALVLVMPGLLLVSGTLAFR